MFCWFMWPRSLEAQYANPGGWGQILAYMAFCEVSQEQTPGTDAYAGDFGFKVLTASDPAEKTKKLNAEIANGRLAMMAIIGMFFQAEIGFCAHVVCYNSTRQEPPQRVWLRESAKCSRRNHESVSMCMACSKFMKLMFCQPCFQHTACVFVWCCFSILRITALCHHYICTCLPKGEL